jgi:hypothetical protein
MFMLSYLSFLVKKNYQVQCAVSAATLPHSSFLPEFSGWVLHWKIHMTIRTSSSSSACQVHISPSPRASAHESPLRVVAATTVKSRSRMQRQRNAVGVLGGTATAGMSALAPCLGGSLTARLEGPAGCMSALGCDFSLQDSR